MCDGPEQTLKSFLTTLSGRLRRLSADLGPSTASYVEVERAEQTFYLNYLRDGMTVFDVGANIGELALLFSRFVGASGCVHGFEACSDTFSRFSSVVGAAGRQNIVLNHLALSDHEGVVRLHLYEGPYSSWNSQALRPLENYGIYVKPIASEEVEATTVDAYCERNQVEMIDLLKVDVEGAEFQVLLGATGMLRQKRVRCITFEFGQTTFDMGNSPSEIEDYLKGHGYKLRNIVDGDPIFPGRESVEHACFSMHVATL
jgi:FkbM family methyltransferase